MTIPGPVVLRDGTHATVARKGLISGNVLVGDVGGKPTCWHQSGRWRWDEVDTPLDIVGAR